MSPEYKSPFFLRHPVYIYIIYLCSSEFPRLIAIYLRDIQEQRTEIFRLRWICKPTVKTSKPTIFYFLWFSFISLLVLDFNMIFVFSFSRSLSGTHRLWISKLIVTFSASNTGRMPDTQLLAENTDIAWFTLRISNCQSGKLIQGLINHLSSSTRSM